MEGENGVLAYMKKKVEKNGICVVVIAEGAGQVEDASNSSVKSTM